MVLAFLGDIHNNVARSLALGTMKLGMDLRLCDPRELWPEQKYATELLDFASTTNAKLRVCQDQSEARFRLYRRVAVDG